MFPLSPPILFKDFRGEGHGRNVAVIFKCAPNFIIYINIDAGAINGVYLCSLAFVRHTISQFKFFYFHLLVFLSSSMRASAHLTASLAQEFISLNSKSML